MMVLACVGFMASCASTQSATTPTAAAHSCECGDKKEACTECGDKAEKKAHVCECGDDKGKTHDHKTPKTSPKKSNKS